MRVLDIRFVPAKPEMRESGLRGWASVTIDGLILDGLEVRRKLSGGYRVRFPTRLDSNGVEHAIVRPVNSASRAEIESAVLGELSKRGFIQ